MKSIQDLAREAGFVVDESAARHQPNCVFHTWHMVDEGLQRFAALVIEQEHARLLALTDTPDTHCFDDDTRNDVWSYSKEQMAAAVLRATLVERERDEYQRAADDLAAEAKALRDGIARAVLAEVDSLTAELQEQARVNGMGGEREAALMAKVEHLTAENEDHIQQLRKEQLTVQELYSERNFCQRCGKRLVGDGSHTCTPPHNIETDPAKIRATFEKDDE